MSKKKHKASGGSRLNRPYLTVAEAADALNCDPEDVWYKLETGHFGAVALAEIEADGQKYYDYVWVPPEALRRIRGGGSDSIEWERHPSLLGKACIKADPEQIRVLRHFVEMQAAEQRAEMSDALSQKEATAYLNVIGALTELLTTKSTEGKRLFPSEASIIAAIQAQHPKTYGLSKRELEEKFAHAKRTLQST